ncbi:AMP-binding protein, partial [Streptomyces leeuwenhoekii]|uniref:AMP-binding protein n=1 Tax=Streptomyces leeuwenhoekii TaxID=1437453 RepID=UPI0036AB5EE1
MTTATELFRRARDFLLEHREDYATAYEGFAWPRPERFNWALDWFDVIADGNDRTALHLVEEDGSGTRVSFAEMSARSDRVANWLRGQGVGAEDRVLVMLGNQVELWETALAAMKLRAVVIPATPLLGPADLRDRVERGRVAHVIVRSQDMSKFDGVPGRYTRIAVGGAAEGWLAYEEARTASDVFVADGPTYADDPLMLYFTSGTTARPKLVEHTHTSYPVGHLATMYWIGLRPGDVHL